MTDYLYKIRYLSRYGMMDWITCPSEEVMFSVAVQLDAEGAELLDARRIEYRVENGIAHYIETRRYHGGRPTEKVD